MLGALFAVLSAATFAFNNATLRRGVINTSVFQALSVTVPLGVPLFFIGTVLAGQLGALGEFGGLNLFYLAAAGILHFVWGRYCGYRSIKAMGSNLSSPVQSTNLIVALGVAMWVLDEYLTPLKIAGLVMILGGSAIAVPTARNRKKPVKPVAEGETPFEPKIAEGMTFALLSATGYGLSPVLVKLGLSGVSAPFAAGLVSYTAATLFFMLFLIPKGRLAHILMVDRRALPWFVNSGFFAFLAQMFRYLALAIAPVTVVTPIQRLTGIFRIIFSTMLNPGHEVLNLRLLVGTAISIAGAVALTISIDFVAEYIELPRVFLEWRWP
jgi:uncharacterized membrane protein